jgi:hypothetical protein
LLSAQVQDLHFVATLATLLLLHATLLLLL